MLNERAQKVLKTLIERYIHDGTPVGSKTLSQLSGLELSSASIRNVLSDMESMGLVISPHTSAGRIPTARGYRLFVDHLIRVNPLEDNLIHELNDHLQPDSPQRLATAASELLSELTQFAGVVVIPQKSDIAFRHMEFLRLSQHRVLLILVTLDGDVRNQLMQLEKDYSTDQLNQAANFINQHYAGMGLSAAAKKIQEELETLHSDISSLMQMAIQSSRQSTDSKENAVVISGGNKLLHVNDLSEDLGRLKELFSVFEQKTELLQLLNQGKEAKGVSLFIGEESGVTTLGDCTVVTAPYRMGEQVVGTLGVVGPTRMDYQTIIPIVDMTSRLVSRSLSMTQRI